MTASVDTATRELMRLKAREQQLGIPVRVPAHFVPRE